MHDKVYSTVCVMFTSSYIPAVVTTPLHVMEDGCLAAPEGGASTKKKQWKQKTSYSHHMQNEWLSTTEA